MMKKIRMKVIGFTLLEMLLVLAIASTLMIMLLGYVTQKADEQRRDRVTLQIQQVLNAGLMYYVDNGKWPTALSDLAPTYISATLTNPWAKGFTLTSDDKLGTLTVTTDITNDIDAGIVAGRLPNASVVADPVTSLLTDVKSTVTIPGQNLNNARSLNFGSIYHGGACVPAPKCPGGMKETIFVVPSSVNGVFDIPTDASGNPCTGAPSTCTYKSYPINGFTATAIGAAGSPAGTTPVLGGVGLGQCRSNATPLDCSYSNPGEIDPNTKYWRVCLYVTTEKGPVDVNNLAAGWYNQGLGLGTVLAVTRCEPPGEPAGHSFGVFMP